MFAAKPACNWKPPGLRSHLADWGFSLLCPCAVHYSECECSWPQCRLAAFQGSSPDLHMDLFYRRYCNRRSSVVDLLAPDSKREPQQLCIHMCRYITLYVYVHMYIYRERERKRDVATLNEVFPSTTASCYSYSYSSCSGFCFRSCCYN